jgi:hypothetical protein
MPIPDKKLEADIMGVLAHLRERKYGLQMNASAPGSKIYYAFCKQDRYPHLDRFIVKGEAFAAVAPGEGDNKGTFVPWYRAPEQSEAAFIDEMRRRDAVAIIDATWIEVAERLYRVQELTHELYQQKKTYHDLTDLLVLASQDAAHEPEITHALRFAVMAQIIDKLEVLAIRMDRFEAAADVEAEATLEASQPPPLSLPNKRSKRKGNPDGARNSH